MILILGGNGFVGSGFVRVLSDQDVPFDIITRENYESFVGHSCEVFVNANGNSKKFLANKDPKGEFQASVASVRNSLADFKFGTYVFLSTSDVYPDCSSPELTHESAAIDVDKQSPYGFHKYLAEQCVQHSAERWLIVRQGGFVGPGLKKNSVFDVLFGKKLFVHPDSRFQMIHTDDSARAILKLIDLDLTNEIFNLTAQETISPAEIMRIVGRQVPHADDASPVTYEISTQKAQTWLELPKTEDCIKRYIEDLENGP